MIIATVKGFTLALIEVQNEALPQALFIHTTTENSLCQLSCQLNSFLTSCFQHLGYDARWASSLAPFHLTECNRKDLRELITWALKFLKFDNEQPSIVLNPCFSHPQRPNLSGAAVWRYGKHFHHLGIPWHIPPSLPQTLPAIWHALRRAWDQCRQFSPPWPHPPCLPSSGHCML